MSVHKFSKVCRKSRLVTGIFVFIVTFSMIYTYNNHKPINFTTMAKKIKRFKKIYFLFGEQITRILENDGIDKAVEAAKNGENYALYYWDEFSTPQELLVESEGWEGWMNITKSQYTKFSKMHDKLSKL